MSIPVSRARPAAAVPPGRIPYDLNAPVMLLHTMQSGEAFRELESTGHLTADPSRAHYAEPYAWMYEQMNRRLPTRGQGALWLWAKIRRDDLIQNVRDSCGEVLLTCRIPRERVLVSQFDDWHQVLDGFPNVLPLAGESDDDYGDRRDRILDDLYGRAEAAGAANRLVWDWPDALRSEVMDSWETIFDPANYPRTHYWQATVHELSADDVIEAVWIER
ncbi:DUF3841 domain-containing protein [Sinomonas sp. P10A9]|uniref:DUF3841 domain-containing protein n=1 Tax=Sinomonas puerhi TaxID=3238584 RepID=A0AB39L7R5_9MICC